MAYFSTEPASERRNPTGKNRVWDFFRLSNETRPANRRQPAQQRRKIRPAAMKTASGIPYWPSRDPIGEQGGMNLYGFLSNDGVNWIDLVGLKIIVRRPTEAPDPAGSQWRKIFANKDNDRIKKDYPRIDQFEDDFAKFKKQIEESLAKLKECCDKHKDLLGETGACKLLSSPEEYPITLYPQAAGHGKEEPSFDSNSGKDGTTMGVPPGAPVATLNQIVYERDPNNAGVWKDTRRQTVTGLLAHELQHVYEYNTIYNQPGASKNFDGPDAESLIELWQDKMEKSGVDAENKFRKCCPELGENFTRDRYTRPDQKYLKK